MAHRTAKDFNARFPGWAGLLDLWLKTHFTGQPAVVFCQPLSGDPTGIVKRMEEMQKRFGCETGHVVNAEYAILPCASVGEANTILRETPKEAPYTMVWDGKAIINHH